MRLAALSDDFNFEARIGASESGRHVPERQGMVDAVAKGTRSHPSYGLAVMPDRLIADSVGVGRVDFEGHQPQRAAALLLFSGGRTANELTLLQVDESAEACFKWPIDRAVFAGPAAETLFDAHGIQRAATEQPQSELGAGLDERIVERTLIVGGHPDLEPEIAGEGDSSDIARHHADFHAPERHKWKCRGGQVVAHQSLQQRSGMRTCNR